MKKIILYSVILFALSSCSDFLKESSQDLMIPKSVKDYKEFFYGEGLSNNTVMHQYLDIMTDDVADYTYSGKGLISNDWREPMWAYYTWQATPEVGYANALTPDVAWDTYYHKILISNIIIKTLPAMTGTESERMDLAGEAYFIRAYSYFMLTNLYGLPYNKATAQKDMCVPLNFEFGVIDVSMTRASVAQVYAQIESDINSSIQNFKRSGVVKTIFRPNLATSYLLASRVALFQQKYDLTIKYVDSVLMNSKATMYDMKSMPGDPDKKQFLAKANTEIMFSFGTTAIDSYLKNEATYAGCFVPSSELLALYDKTKDLRYVNFYKEKTIKNIPLRDPRKWMKTGHDIYSYVFRLSEAYLNRAEAYAATKQSALAINDLNTIRRNRFKSDGELTQGTDEQVMTAVRNERRMEFAFESFRWFDLRRWDRPAITHRYSSKATPGTGDSYALTAGSISYTLPIPKNEREKNPAIEQLDRPESTPIK